MRVILNIIAKEARELLTPQMLAPFLAMMVVFAVIGRVMRGEQAKSKEPQTVMVADHDSSAVSQMVFTTLSTENLIPVKATGETDELLHQAQAANLSWLVVIPRGLADSVSLMRPATIEVYNIVRGFSVLQAMRGIEVKTLLAKMNNQIADDHLLQAYPNADPKVLRAPLAPKEFVMVKGRVAPGNADLLQALVFSQTFMIPIVLLMIIIYSSQMIAASIGQEKENKTLETLLTTPIRRTSIVIGKMLGASLVAVIVAGIFMAAMGYYMGSFAAQMPTAGAGPTGGSVLAQLDIGMTLQSFLFIGIALFLAVIAALSLSTLLAVFADDAKSAQMNNTPLMMIVMIPYFFSMFFDVSTASLPVKLIVYAIPFSYPFLTPKAVFFGNYGLVFAGFAYMAAFAAACIFIAARVFASDRILTARLRLRRRARP